MAKHAGGRPRKMTALKARKIVDAYFKDIDAHKDDRDIHKKVPTVSGLCRKLGITRETLNAWSKENGKYSDAANYARTRLVEFWEPLLLRPGSGQGVSFWLRNQGWNEDRKPSSAEAEVKTPGGDSIKVTFHVTGTDQQLDV